MTPSQYIPAVLVVALAIVGATPASSCGGPFDVLCNTGKTLEKAGQDVGRETGRIFNQARTDVSNGLNRVDPRFTQIGRDIDRMRLEFQSSVFTGPALEQWIIQSRNDAMNGAMPMPLDVRQNLQGWYDDRLMNLVRYKVGDGGELNLANNVMRFGHPTAITLIDVIVFRGPTEANNYALWAHEMKHVQQYDQWGVHSFAVQYMRSWNSVEDPAYEVENRFAGAWKQRNGRGAPMTPSVQQGPPNIIRPGLAPTMTMQAPVNQQRVSNICVVGPQPYQRCLLVGFFPILTNCSCGPWYGMTY